MTADYGTIGTAGAIAFIAFMQYWNNHRLNQIHALTNSAMTYQKKMLAEVTAAKFAITKDKSDKANADAAMKDYLSAVAKA